MEIKFNVRTSKEYIRCITHEAVQNEMESSKKSEMEIHINSK